MDLLERDGAFEGDLDTCLLDAVVIVTLEPSLDCKRQEHILEQCNKTMKRFSKTTRKELGKSLDSLLATQCSAGSNLFLSKP